MMTEAEQPATLGIRIPADPARVAIVRRALTHFLRAVAAEEDFVADINTAVSEACENAIVHGYPNGSKGPVDVKLFYSEPNLTIIVRDEGTGMRPGVSGGGGDDEPAPRLRLGLPLMSALSNELHVSARPGHGTEVTMNFDLGNRPSGEWLAATNHFESVSATELTARADDPSGIESLRPAVLMLAAQTGMTVDRIKDLGLLTDSIVAAAARRAPGPLNLRLETPDDRGVRIVIGPLESGEGDGFLSAMSLPIPGGGVELLADEVSVEPGDSGDCVILGISASSR